MKNIVLNKGHNIQIAGVPSKEIFPLTGLKTVSIIPTEFRDVKPKLLVKEGDKVESGDLIVLRRGVTVLSSNDVGWRFFFAFCSGTLSMIVVASLSMMISSFVNNAIGPIVGTISIIIGLNIIFTLGAPLFEDIIPYVFTSHFIKWQYFFDFNLDKVPIYNAIVVQLSYIIIFNVIGIIHFKNKDILS